jgi:glutamyl-Q tRNA(Asp) synthetase
MRRLLDAGSQSIGNGPARAVSRRPHRTAAFWFAGRRARQFLEARHVAAESGCCASKTWICPAACRAPTDAILRALDRHGLHWDGPVWYQSQRREGYRGGAGAIVASRAGLPLRPAPGGNWPPSPHASDGAPIYPGTIAATASANRAARAIRLRVTDTPLAFHDAYKATYAQDLEREVGDFVIRRADGLFAYQLAVVVDDADQGITQIVRGGDLLDSTPGRFICKRCWACPRPPTPTCRWWWIGGRQAEQADRSGAAG